MSRPPEVIIIGGGISGLATAWWLAQADIPVEVWEREQHPGGKIQTTAHQGYLLEQAAALLLNFRPEVAEFVEQSGLEPLKSRRTPLAEQNRYLLDNGQLNAMRMKMGDFILSSQWSLQGKLRMMLEPLLPRGGSESETVTQFITRRFGHELLEKAMDPFVSGTLASDPDRANAEATLGRLTALERKYGSLTLGAIIYKIARKHSACITETFSFEGGMSTLVEQLAQHPGITLRTNHRATSVEPGPYGWQLHTTDYQNNTRHHHAREVIFSTPAHTTAHLLQGVAPEVSRLLQGVEYASLDVLHTGFDRAQIAHPLDGTGFLTPRREPVPFNGNIWMSSLFRGRAPEGKSLLTTYLGGARHPEVSEWSEQQIVERTLEALEPILGIQGAPEMVQLQRHRQALPLYHGPYAARMRQLQHDLKQHRGLHIAANYLGGISVRDRIAQGQQLAQRLITSHAPRTHASSSPLWKEAPSSLAGAS